MAYIKPNQPVIFNESVDLCSTDTDYYVQIVDNTDKTQFQLGLTICNGQSQLFPDPNFNDPPQYTLGANWAISANTLCHTAGSIQPVYTIEQFGDDTQYYQVSIIVYSISAGATFNVYFGSTLVGTFSTVGSHTFYGFPSGGVGARPLIIQPQNSVDTVCIIALTSFEILTNFGVLFYNTETGSQTVLFYQDDTSYFSFVDDSLTITIDWAEFATPNTCYQLCILDPCENTNGQNYPANITNPQFTGSATGWTVGDNWVYSSNTIEGTFSGVSGHSLSQDNVFINYSSTYSVTIVVTQIVSGGSFTVSFGSTVIATISTVGTHIVTGTPEVSLGITITLVASVGAIIIDSIIATSISVEDYICDYTSNTFKLSDYSCACPETLLINACNDEDGLGFVFNGSGFTPRLRLQAKLKQAKYPSQRIVEEDSNGTKRVIYFNGKKAKNLVADLLPEYIHDFLRTLGGYDRFYINGVDYFVEDDEYNVTYDDSQDNVGSITLLVSEKTQLIRNVNCDAIENSCALPQLGSDCDATNTGNYILQEDDATQYITLENGELIELES